MEEAKRKMEELYRFFVSLVNLMVVVFEWDHWKWTEMILEIRKNKQ